VVSTLVAGKVDQSVQIGVQREQRAGRERKRERERERERFRVKVNERERERDRTFSKVVIK